MLLDEIRGRALPAATTRTVAGCEHRSRLGWPYRWTTVDAVCAYIRIAAMRRREKQMTQRVCPRHGGNQPCTCAMGNLYRFVEPVVLLLLKQKGQSYGYDLSGELQSHALTDAEIERAALYRTLRQLEMNGNLRSDWDTDKGGPARRVYRLTPKGEDHLAEWAAVLEHLSQTMANFVENARACLAR